MYQMLVGQRYSQSELQVSGKSETVGESAELHTMCTFRVEIHMECAPVGVLRIVRVILEIGYKWYNVNYQNRA